MIVSLPVDFLVTALRPAVTAAAAACLPQLGSGDGTAVDGAAVAAMRAALVDAAVDGRVVVGEGEKDEAPMLHLGERFGRAMPGDPSIDIAVDPVDGTRLAAAGRPGAMAVLAAAPRGGFFDLGPAHYLEKLITWVPGVTASDSSGGDAWTADASDGDGAAGRVVAAVPALVARAAELRGVAPASVRIAVQDRPRNRAYVEAVQAAGASVELFEHGDVERSLRALHGGDGAVRADDERERGVPGLDAVLGIGGAPEGVIVAAAVRALGGSMLARFAPQSERERARVVAHLGDAARVDAVVDLDGLCPASAELLVAAVTDCEIGVALPGVRAVAEGRRVHWWTASDGGRGSSDFPAG